MNTLIKEAEACLGEKVQAVRRLSGGDLSAVYVATTINGARIVFKSGPDPRAEADMLAALSAAGAQCPRVIAVNDVVLVLEYLGSETPPSAQWVELANMLKAVHASEGPTYGWPCPYAFAAVEIENTVSTTWPNYWGERRLLCHARFAGAALGQRLESLCARLPDLLPEAPKRSLLHGDLWSGNLLWTARGPALIDPACYYGHGEVDLAMLCLFDTPPRAFWEAYGDLEPGHDVRCAIYQLWPALVHLRLFGAGYRPMVTSRLERLKL